MSSFKKTRFGTNEEYEFLQPQKNVLFKSQKTTKINAQMTAVDNPIASMLRLCWWCFYGWAVVSSPLLRAKKKKCTQRRRRRRSGGASQKAVLLWTHKVWNTQRRPQTFSKAKVSSPLNFCYHTFEILFISTYFSRNRRRKIAGMKKIKKKLSLAPFISFRHQRPDLHQQNDS